MKNLQSMKKTIDSTSNLYSIVNTMKAHASTNIIQFQQASSASMAYRLVLDKALYVVLNQMPEANIEKPSTKGKKIYVVFGSDHGLCGRFNERIIVYADQNIVNEKNAIIFVIGQQVVSRLNENFFINEPFPVPQTTEGVTSSVQKLLVSIDEIRSREPISEILLLYNKPSGKIDFVETTERLFPLDLKKLWRENLDWESNSIPTFFMAGETLLQDLVQQYFFITLYRAFCYSLVAENESRIASMTSAKKNIEEKLEEQQTLYKQIRQNAITDEIRDITSGFMAFKKSNTEDI